MKKIIYIIAILITVNLNPVKACSCGWNGGLVKNAQKNHLTIHGRVNRLMTFTEVYKDTVTTSIEVEILTRFKGEETRKFITIWGDRGTDCRPYLSGVPIGSEWIFSLHEIQDEEYAVSICGEHITPVKKNHTWGYIIYNDRCTIEKPIIMTLDSLRLAIENPSKYVFATRSCKEGEENYYIEANHFPKITEDKTIEEFLKEELQIPKDLSKYEDRITVEVFVSSNGDVEKITYAEGYFQTSKMKRRYGKKIISLLKKSSPWIPGRHRHENIPMKLTLDIKAEDLIRE